MIDVTDELLLPAESTQKAADVETKLKSEIQLLWLTHQEATAGVKQSKEQVKALRLDLGRKLSEMKTILVRTGRGGGWAGYLRSCDLPRASAERYIQRHELLLNPKQIDSPETVSEPSAEDVRRLVGRLMPRLRRVLVTPGCVAQFLQEVVLQWATADKIAEDGEEASPGRVVVRNLSEQSETEAALPTFAA